MALATVASVPASLDALTRGVGGGVGGGAGKGAGLLGDEVLQRALHLAITTQTLPDFMNAV